MISRTLKWTLGAGVALLSPLTLAVGLGEIQLRSAMEERFSAEIELLQIGDLNEHQMAVNLAPPEDFERAGMDRDYQLADLRFQVDLSKPNRPVIKVSSRRPIHEPYLNFLVELRWPSGRLLREYTALLDLPTFAGETAVGKTSAAAPKVAAERTAAIPVPRSTAAPRVAEPASGAPASGRVQVRSGETLWAIARRHQVPGASIHQVMQAIAAANPDAFIGGDVNLLRRDAWLNIPDAVAMKSADAGRMTASLQKPPAVPPVVESQPSVSTEPAAPADGELRLTAIDDDTTEKNSGSGSEAGATGTPGAEGGTSLASALEERDRLQRENDDLRQQIKNLEAQVNTASRLVELDAPELAALQEQSAATTADSAAATGSTAADPSTAVSGEAAPTGPADEPIDAAAKSSAETAAVAPDQQSAAPSKDKQPAVVPSSADEKTGPVAPLTALGDRLIPVLGVTAAVLLGLLLLVSRRRGSGVQQRGLVLPSETAPPSPSPRDTREFAELDAEDGFFSETSPADEVTSLLNEADICLSLGHEEQAEELLRDGLVNYPQNANLHLKLLETLTARDDRDGFETHLPRLAALGDLDAFTAAQALQRQFAVPDQPNNLAQQELGDRNPEENAQAVGNELPLDEFDLGLELDLDEAAQQASFREVDAPANDLENFDLGLEQATVQETGFDRAVPDPAFEDLDLFEPGQEVATQLELARAYVDMGDTEGAREILDHVIEAGDAEQQQAARQLLERLA